MQGEGTSRIPAGWEKLLNPAVLRQNLISASLFIAAFELFRSATIERVRGFFQYGFDEKGPIYDEKYKTDVLSLDKNPFCATQKWLQQQGCLDSEGNDLEQIKNLAEHRNDLAHRMAHFLGFSDKEIDPTRIDELYAVTAKIDRWWVRNIEAGIDPEILDESTKDADIQSGTMLVIQLMTYVALSDDAESFWKSIKAGSGNTGGL